MWRAVPVRRARFTARRDSLYVVRTVSHHGDNGVLAIGRLMEWRAECLICEGLCSAGATSDAFCPSGGLIDSLLPATQLLSFPPDLSLSFSSLFHSSSPLLLFLSWSLFSTLFSLFLHSPFILPVLPHRGILPSSSSFSFSQLHSMLGVFILTLGPLLSPGVQAGQEDGTHSAVSCGDITFDQD